MDKNLPLFCVGYLHKDNTWEETSVCLALQEDFFGIIPVYEIALWKNICRKRVRGSMVTPGGGSSCSHYVMSFPFFLSLFSDFSSLFLVEKNRRRVSFTLTVDQVESWLGRFDMRDTWRQRTVKGASFNRICQTNQMGEDLGLTVSYYYVSENLRFSYSFDFWLTKSRKEVL